MVDRVNRLQGLIPSADELKKATGWEDWVVLEILSILENVTLLAEAGDESDANASLNQFDQIQANLNALNDRIGGCDYLTSDETGFTVDTNNLTVDMTLASPPECPCNY